MVDGTTRVPVQFGDRNNQDNSDDDEFDEGGVKDEGNEIEPGSVTMSASEGVVSPPMLQTSNLQSPDESEFFRSRPIPVHQRYATQSHGPIDDNHSYSDSYLPRNMNVGFQQVSPTVPDPLRRSFTSSNFQQQNMYGWQNNMVTNPGQTQYYVSSPQTTLPPQSVPYQLPPPIAGQSMLPPPPLIQHHFTEGLSNARYDSGPALGNQLRTGSLGHPHHIPHGFPEYMQDNTYGHHEAEIKQDPGPHMHTS